MISFSDFRSAYPLGIMVFTSLDDVLVTINSSINFIIYYVLGKSFRDESIKMVKELKEKIQKLCSIQII